MKDSLDDLRQRFEQRCGCGGVHEQELGAALEIDHYRPRSAGGAAS